MKLLCFGFATELITLAEFWDWLDFSFRSCRFVFGSECPRGPVMSRKGDLLSFFMCLLESGALWTYFAEKLTIQYVILVGYYVKA